MAGDREFKVTRLCCLYSSCDRCRKARRFGRAPVRQRVAHASFVNESTAKMIANGIEPRLAPAIELMDQADFEAASV